jgi:polyisoprenoid-binding protein YceI
METSPAGTNPGKYRYLPILAQAVGLERRLALAALLLTFLWLAACRTPPRPAPAPSPGPVPPAAPAPPISYRIDAARSQVLILVYRDGPMARLGHNHVLSVQQLSGEIAAGTDPALASFWLEFPVAAISVDEPSLRAAAGDDFKTPVDAAAVDGTRSHMLGEQLLDAAHFPTIRLQSERLRAEGDHWIATVHIRVRDHEGVVEVPVALERSPDGLTASGEFDLTHAQLGLIPYSVALGALRVAESMHIRYRLQAQL